jgi:hypothetical protein
MTDHDERGLVTAEYSVGTLGAVLIAAVLYKLGMLDHDNPWLDNLHDILERSLSWGTWRDLFDHMPRFGIRIR